MSKNNVLLIAKNDIEGIASSILLSSTIFSNPDIAFYKYDTDLTKIQIDKNYDLVCIVGIKNSYHQIKSHSTLHFKSFDLVSAYCSNKSEFNNSMELFNIHIISYLDWTWKDKKLYYGKNIDELAKYFSKKNLVKTISERLKNEQEIITDLEREIIIFAKKLLTSYIDNTNYKVIENNGVKYGCVFSNAYEIELVNKLLNEVDVAILINLSNNMVRVKTRPHIKMQDNIINLGGLANNHGGTVRLPLQYDKIINTSLFKSLIEALEGGIINE